ncbi:uncharacterized protein LOC131433775, partial [Malaya genurostris]|uniref:uncharacterized protein LOC131433775 n=1 Tax=Malaya genurostris TaxID=325434 RepID=UPI0026F3A737
FADCDCVKITRLSVPQAYILEHYHRQHDESNELYAGGGRGKAIYRYDTDTGTDELVPSSRDQTGRRHNNNDHLILDCEYEIDVHEKGFVLKWYFNGKLIYQWIPPRRSPLGFNAMKYQVNRSYTVSDEEMHKHRALALIRPLKNFTGEYACAVSTFQSEDTRSASMLVIVPESSFVLKYYNSDISNLVTVLCSAYGIFPRPMLSLWINEHQLENVTSNVLLTQTELYDSSISIQLVLYESIQPDDVVKCMLGINGTEYAKTKETVFIDVSSKSAIEYNSVLDSDGSTSMTISHPSASPSTAGSTTSTTSYGETTSVLVTTKHSTELEDQPVEEQPPSSTSRPSIVVLPVGGSGRTYQLGAPQQSPAVVRLRPTSARVLTVQQANPNIASSDEVTNVLDFKEIPFNENLLYSNNGSTQIDTKNSGWMTLLVRFLALATSFGLTRSLLNIGAGNRL